MKPTPRSPRPLRSLGWGLAWVAATVASLLAFARPATAPIDGDEIYWIGSAYYFDLAFGRGDWTNPDWALLPARENPPVAKYVLGLGLAAAGQPITSIEGLAAFYAMYEAIPGAWGEGTDYAKRAAVVGRVSPDLRQQFRDGPRLPAGTGVLLPARRVTVACGILASLLLFILGWQAAGPLAGWIASELLLLHPLVIHAYTHALADIVALVFATAAAMAVFSFARQAVADHGPSRYGQITTALGVGLLLGLACGAKMNSLVVVGLAGATFASSTVVVWRRDRTRGIRTTLAGAIALVAAVVVFVAINPAIWRDIPAGLLATVQEHQATERIQARFVGGYLSSFSEKAVAVGQLALFSSLGLAILLLLALAALRVRSPALRFASAWFLLSFLFVTPWIPFALGRYALPVVLPAALLVGVLIGAAVDAISRRLRPAEASVITSRG